MTRLYIDEWKIKCDEINVIKQAPMCLLEGVNRRQNLLGLMWLHDIEEAKSEQAAHKVVVAKSDSSMNNDATATYR